MATGSAPSAGRRRSENARFGCLLFMWFVMFGLGFLAGISATKRAARGPVWLQSLFGIAPGSPLAPAPTPPPALVASNVPVNTAPPPTSVPAPNPTPTQPPANTQPTPAPNTQPTNTSPLDRSQPSTTDPSTSHDPTPPVKPSAELDGKVKDYNRALKRIQDAYKTYEATKKVTEGQTHVKDVQPALDTQNAALDEVVAGVQRAQTLLEALQADQLFAENYIERDLALPYHLPPSLVELSVDKLRFVQKR